GHHRGAARAGRGSRSGTQGGGRLASLGQGARLLMVEQLEERFPGLRGTPYHVTSPATRDYNCIAWAVGATAHWWWPDVDLDDAVFWPTGVALEETLAALDRK